MQIGNLIDVVWWGCQAIHVYKEAQDLKENIQTLVSGHHPSNAYVVTVTKVVTFACDCLALKKDAEAYGLKGVDLDKNQITSAKFQAAACASKIAGNLIQTNQAIDPDVLVRLLAICRRTGQGIGSPFLEGIPNAITTSAVLAFANETIHDQFSYWYAVHAATAAGIKFELDYTGIPEKHHGNLIFNQFIDPISLEPIRFPVTAPNKLGGPDHHFERATILTWLTKHETNPVTNLPLTISELVENVDMRKIIEDEMEALGLDLV